MTPNRGPVNRCAVRGCVFVGYWPEGELCPEHRRNPLTDGAPTRRPDLAETWQVDE
jgi:hypothetical protein